MAWPRPDPLPGAVSLLRGCFGSSALGAPALQMGPWFPSLLLLLFLATSAKLGESPASFFLLPQQSSSADLLLTDRRTNHSVHKRWLHGVAQIFHRLGTGYVKV